MANKQELEESLIKRVSKKIGKDNQTLEEVIEKIMQSVDNWEQEHKKELAELDDTTKQKFKNPNFLLSKLIKIKYEQEKLIHIVYRNLKRAPGNLSEEQRMFALYKTFAKFGYACPYSGTLLLGGKQQIHLEHIIPVAMGGPTDDWNCIPICGTCNKSKSDKHLLDWWKDNRKIEEEYKLVKIFEHMTSKLLDETNKVKYIKQENNPMHLDVITFLNQLLNHIEENKQYIFDKKFDSEKEKQNAINSKLKELKSNFEKVVKKNDRNTKTDKQYFTEQKEMVKYVKSLGVSSYYKVAYTYFNTIKEMQNLGKSEEEIKEFCIAQDDWFTPFYEKLIAYKESHNESFFRVVQDKEIGGTVSRIRVAKKGKGGTKLTEEMIKKLDAIGFPWEVEKVDWFTPFYEKLIVYKQSHNGSFYGVVQDKEIGGTVSRVRVAKKGKGSVKLTSEMIEKLDTIGFPWKVDWFTEFYKKLIVYKESHKGSFIGVRRDREIGNVVGSIRQSKKGKGSYKLTEEMIKKLDTIGFPWEREDWFTPFYEKLIEYKKAHNGSFAGVGADKEIGSNVKHIRRAYKGKGGTKLTKEMISKFDAIGFTWVVEKADWFTPFYEKLIIYKQANNGSFDLVGTDTEIGKTVNRVRLSKKGKGDTKLTKEMIEKLDAIGFPWIVEKEDWFTPFYEKLIEYKKLHNGGFDGVATDKEIGGQISGVRQAKKGKGSYKLTPAMIKKLDAIGFPWEGRTKKQKEDNLTI